MSLDQADVKQLLLAVADLWGDNLQRFNEIDSKYGDGDHGVTIGKIVRLINATVPNWPVSSQEAPNQEAPGLKRSIVDLAAGIMGIGGGSAGPLYGLLFEGLATPMVETTEFVDAAMMKAMLQGSRDALAPISGAKIGDKTMMDALLPAVAAAQTATDDVGDILATANAAAAEGAAATAQMVAKFGRARSYGERTLGTPDVGALSTALFFEGLDSGYQKIEGSKNGGDPQ